MLKNKKIMKYAACASVLCCLFVTNIGYAASEYTSLPKTLLSSKQKELSKLENNSKEFIELNTEIASLQNELNQSKKAVESLQTALNAAKENYGENSFEAGHTYFKLAGLYAQLFDLENSKASLDSLYDVILATNPKAAYYKNLNNLYYRSKANFYNLVEQNQNTLKVLEIFKRYVEKSNLQDSLYLSNQFASTKSSLKDFRNAEFYLKNTNNILAKNKDTNLFNYIQYYKLLMFLNLDRNRYSEVLNTYQKIEKLLQENENVSPELKMSINEILLRYYFELSDQENALKVIKENENLAADSDNIYAKYQLYNNYAAYYNMINDYSKYKKYIDKKVSLNKKLSRNISEIGDIPIYESYLYYYLNTNKRDKAIVYANKMYDITSKHKDVAPILHANTLQTLASLYNNPNDSEIGLEYALEAQSLIEKCYKPGSYRFFNLYRLMSALYLSSGDIDTSVKYLKKAETLLVNLQILKQNENIVINEDLANVYVTKGDMKNAILKTDKAITIAKSVYGANNINVYKLLLSKANIYDDFNHTNLSQQYLAEIDSAIKASKIQGHDNTFYYQYYMMLAVKSNQNGNKEEAVQYADKASEFAKRPYEKETLDYLYSDIYNNKPFKSKKYKIKAKFE